MEMAEALIEGMVQQSQLISKGDLNPFKGQSGEILPLNLERSFSGFMVRKNPIKFKVNSEMLLARIALLKEQQLIAKFVGPKPLPQAIRMWIQALN